MYIYIYIYICHNVFIPYQCSIISVKRHVLRHNLLYHKLSGICSHQKCIDVNYRKHKTGHLPTNLNVETNKFLQRIAQLAFTSIYF